MRAVVQRVKKASVEIRGKKKAGIKAGLLVLLGVETGDSQKEAEALVDKIINLRIFESKDGKMNLSLLDKKGEALIVSEFTLCADTSRGRRPSFNRAADPKQAKELYNFFVQKIREAGLKAETGEFGAQMSVCLVNDGPVTIVM